jgi:hypothetical protein
MSIETCSVATCCYFSYAGPFHRGTSQAHGMLTGLVPNVAVSFQLFENHLNVESTVSFFACLHITETVRRATLAWAANHNGGFTSGVKRFSLPELSFLITFFHTFTSGAYYISTVFAHATCAVPTQLSYAPPWR